MRSQRGTSLIDLVLSIAIITVLFGGIYLIYFSILTAINNISLRDASTTAISQEIETIRNLPYASVGTVGGVPAGTIPQTQTVVVGQYSFTLQTTVRNIDDPFDGTLGGNPNDTAPADYKLVSIEATCPLCSAAFDAEVTTTVAPKNLESATQDGSVFVYALDANGDPIADATVHVVNASVTPSIDLTDTTNASGVLELVGVPTSTQRYSVTVTKAGYSTDQTYPPGGVGNPNPVKPNLTVVAQTVSAVTLSIDRVSGITVFASDDRCVPIAGSPFSIQGTKIIGTSPTVPKFSLASTTNASGINSLGNLEWDTYFLATTDATKDLVGTIPLDPITIDPSSTQSFRIVLQSSTDPALLATVVDAATGAGIMNATATLSKAGVSRSLATGRRTLTQTDWSGSGAAGYAQESGGINATSIPGELVMVANSSGTYSTSTTGWLISNTFDLGGSSTTLYSLFWDPLSQPSSTGPQSLALQIAANNDNATWNFVGPDGTGGTYFTSPPSMLPAMLSGKRYVRYEVFLKTQDGGTTPELDDISIDFNADCVPPAQALFTGLPQGTYTLDVTAQNYAENSTTVSVGTGFQSSTIQLTHL